MLNYWCSCTARAISKCGFHVIFSVNFMLVTAVDDFNQKWTSTFFEILLISKFVKSSPLWNLANVSSSEKSCLCHNSDIVISAVTPAIPIHSYLSWFNTSTSPSARQTVRFFADYRWLLVDLLHLLAVYYTFAWNYSRTGDAMRCSFVTPFSAFRWVSTFNFQFYSKWPEIARSFCWKQENESCVGF